MYVRVYLCLYVLEHVCGILCICSCASAQMCLPTNAQTPEPCVLLRHSPSYALETGSLLEPGGRLAASEPQ